MTDALIYALPEAPLAQQQPIHWWRIAGGAMVASGGEPDWPAQAALADGGHRIIALAPVAAVRLDFSEARTTAASPRQAAAIARVAAVEQSIGDPATLHIVSALPDQDRIVVTATVANGTMLDWLDWSKSLGVDPDHIMPIATLLPVGEDWVKAQIGSATLVGRRHLIVPDEPDLVEALIGGLPVETLPPESIEAALVRAAEAPRIDLRIGRFAKRRRLVLDRDRVRELALLAAIIPLLTLLWALISIARLNQSSDRLDAETQRIAATTIGRPSTIEAVATDMAQSLGSAASGGMTPVLTALLNGLQAERGISSTQLAYRGDGTLAGTLAAPTLPEINRLLLALQRDGYRVTAVPRQAADGRSMVEVTIRSGP